MKNITVFVTEGALTCLDELVRKQLYASRSGAIRMAVNDLIQRELTVEERHKIVGLEGCQSLTVAVPKGLLKASEEALEVLTGQRRLDYSKECLMACKVCGLTTVHVKGRKSKKVFGINRVLLEKTRTCKECGNVV